jgi:hypothetical protein
VWMIRLSFVEAARRRTVIDWYLCLVVSVVLVLLDHTWCWITWWCLDYIVVLDYFPLLVFDSFGLV